MTVYFEWCPLYSLLVRSFDSVNNLLNVLVPIVVVSERKTLIYESTAQFYFCSYIINYMGKVLVAEGS